MDTRAIRSTWIGVAGVGLALGGGNAAAVSYSFTNIADSSGPFASFGLPSLNDSGTVAFGAGLDTGDSGIFTGNGRTTTTIVDTSGPFEHFGGYSFNNSGTVAFQAFEHPFQNTGGVFTGNGGPLTLIFRTEEFNNFVISLSLNDHGAVALFAERQIEDLFLTGIFTGIGGSLTTLYDDRETAGGSFDFGNYVPFNNSGTVAFLAFLGPGDGGDTTDGIVTGSGGPLTTIADSSGLFSFFHSSEESPTATYALNDNGTVAFSVGTDAGGGGIFTGNGGSTTTIVDASGPFAGFFAFAGGIAAAFSLNNSGTVAFLASLDSGEFGIFTGPDPLADEVISLGDPLFGSTVVDILMRDESLNDLGEIAFFYELADGRSGIARADPLIVPEPGTLALLGLGLLGLGVVRRRAA